MNQLFHRKGIFIGSILGMYAYIPQLSYVLYILILVLPFIFPLPKRRHKYIEVTYVGLFSLTLLAGIVGIIKSNHKALEHTTLYLLPLVAIFLSDIDKKTIRDIAKTTIVIATPLFFLNLSSLLSTSIIEFLIHSESDTENNAAFVFAIICAYSFQNLSKPYSISSFLLTLSFSKRIALLAIIISFGVYLFSQRKQTIAKISLISIPILWIIATYIISSEWFNNLFYQQFNISLNYLTKGRFEFFSNAIMRLNPTIVPNGIGSVSETMLLIRPNYAPLIHNDPLRLLLDNGIISFIIYFLVIPTTFKTSTQRITWLAFLILQLTDNVSLYVPINLIVFSILFSEYND